MTHWGWYWKIKKKHTRKASCANMAFMEIDSFKFFKIKELVDLIRKSNDRVTLTIPKYNLTATLQDNYSLYVKFDGGSYVIPVEIKPCNFGGYYHFFHCPACSARMRKLYCLAGRYVCRKCANLAYYTQRIRPSERFLRMSCDVMDSLKNRAGSLEKKPPWMKKYTFQRLRIKYVKFDEKHSNEINKELFAWYGVDGEWYFPPSELLDAWVARKEAIFIAGQPVEAILSD